MLERIFEIHCEEFGLVVGVGAGEGHQVRRHVGAVGQPRSDEPFDSLDEGVDA